MTPSFAVHNREVRGNLSSPRSANSTPVACKRHRSRTKLRHGFRRRVDTRYLRLFIFELLPENLLIESRSASIMVRIVCIVNPAGRDGTVKSWPKVAAQIELDLD